MTSTIRITLENVQRPEKLNLQESVSLFMSNAVCKSLANTEQLKSDSLKTECPNSECRKRLVSFDALTARNLGGSEPLSFDAAGNGIYADRNQNGGEKNGDESHFAVLTAVYNLISVLTNRDRLLPGYLWAVRPLCAYSPYAGKEADSFGNFYSPGNFCHPAPPQFAGE